MTIVRDDFKNVNNWHWVEKNCFPWAKEYLEEKLSAIRVSCADGTTLRVNKLLTMDGDVDISQRKGKLIYIFDINMDLEWTGTLTDGTSSIGKVEIRDACQDDDPEEYNMVFKLDSPETAPAGLLSRAKSDLGKLIVAALRQFPVDLLATHGSSIQANAPTKDVKQPSEPGKVSLSSSGSTANAKTLIDAPSLSVDGATIRVTSEFKTSAQELYECLSDPGRLSIWTGEKADYRAEAGASFQLMRGNISGKVLESVPGKKIVQQWRLKEWPANHFSTVTMNFEQGSNSTKIHIVQTGVPKLESDRMAASWEQVYFNRIKHIFGFML